MYITVLITTPRDAAKRISHHLLQRRLAACINTTSVSSAYWWEGRIEEAEEVMLIVKTTVDKLEKLIEEVKTVHPYKVPEIIALPIIGGNREYLSWVERETHA